MQNKGFPVEWLVELKRKNDLISIASNYLQLQQKGSRFWACCPFHNEKTPSFSLNGEDGVYHCFGCKESGDVIKFVQKMESIEFMDAVKLLADKAGMKKGDIIVKVEDTEVENSSHFKYKLYEHKIGDTIKITVKRENKEVTLKVKLESKNNIGCLTVKFP